MTHVRMVDCNDSGMYVELVTKHSLARLASLDVRSPLLANLTPEAWLVMSHRRKQQTQKQQPEQQKFVFGIRAYHAD
jgi:hypothetical protein